MKAEKWVSERLDADALNFRSKNKVVSLKQIAHLLEIEKDLRECEHYLDLTCGRNMSYSKCSDWFDLMEELGFLVNNRFLPIIDIINKTTDFEQTKRTFTLEAVACDLSLIANILSKNG